METAVVHRRLADQLWQADQTAVPIRPLTDQHPDLSIEDAYAIQSVNIDRRIQNGERICGRKIGLTSQPMQELLGVDEPDYGVLLDGMFVEDGDVIDLQKLVQPRVEAEMAFIMERDLEGPGANTATALRAIAGALPAVEIVDSRVADWKIKLVDTVADNASSGLIVMGGRLRRVDELDLRLVGVAVTRRGDLIDTGAGAAALGNPARCVAWLANKLASFGAKLHAGDVVLPGAVHKMVPVAAWRRIPCGVRAPRRGHGSILASNEECRMIDAAEIAKRLISAEQERRAIAPFTDVNPELDTDTAYAAQRMFVQARLDNGERIIGAKLGLTSRVKQKAMGVDSPLFGVVTDRMIAPFGEPIALNELIHPRVEPEIAFVLARDVAAPATVSSVLAATEVVCGAVDVLDSRYEDYRFTLPDVIADNTSAGRFLLGPNQLAPSAIDDIRLLGCVLRLNGGVAATAAGAAAMGHPAASVAWLANQLGERGEVLKAGWIIFSGGLTAPIPLTAENVITAEFDGLGTIEVFAE